MGGFEVVLKGTTEPPVRYHPWVLEDLTSTRESGRGTLSAGQFYWGGILLKSNGGVQSLPHRGWQSREERKGIRQVN